MARTTVTKADAELADTALLASRALVGVIARSVTPALERVSLPQLRVLVLLGSMGTTRSGAIAELVGVHPSTFSRTTDRLVQGGWVRRVANPSSRRETLVELTDAGRRLVAQVMQRRRSELARILVRIPPDRREALLDAFEEFSLAAGETSLSELATLGV